MHQEIKFTQKPDIGIDAQYQAPLPNGGHVTVQHRDLGAHKIAELYFSNQDTPQGAPSFRYVNGWLETGCPDSDNASYRPKPLDSQTLEGFLKSYQTLPADVRKTVGGDNPQYLKQHMLLD